MEPTPVRERTEEEKKELRMCQCAEDIQSIDKDPNI